jgi:serine/threonine protein kinase
MSFLKEYTLLGELGKGGFAKVYKVRHNELGYIRAIRVLNEPITDERSRTYQKFLHECKVLLRLGNGSHRNIVHIYQPRLLDNHALVEMDYVDGQDITHYLKDNGNYLPIEEVMRMVEEMSNALAYCHEDIYQFCMDPDEDDLQNDPIDGSKWLIDEATKKRLIEKYKVIHNDIHSGNIMRRRDGSFVLLDFGLAIEGDEVVKSSSRHENGAPEYMPPEKWDNDTILTEQSDIYSFGVVMYEYLAGRVPFVCEGNSFNARTKLYDKIKNSTSLPSIVDLRKSFFEEKRKGESYKKDFPDWLETAILKCLEKDPDKRFRNGKELHDYITKHLQDEAITKESFQSLSEEIVSLKNERQHALAQIADLSKKNDDLSNLVNTTARDLEQARIQLANLQGKQDDRLSRELGDLQNSVRQKDDEIERLRKDIAKLEYQVTTSGGNNSELQKQIDFLQVQCGGLENQLKKTNDEKRKLEEEIAILKANQGAKTKPLPIILCVLFGIVAAVLGFLYANKGGDSIPGDYNTLKTENAELMNTNKDLQSLVNGYEKQVADLNAEINDLKAKKPTNSTREKELQEQLNQANSNISNLEKQITDLNAEINRLKKTNQSPSTREKELESQLNQANSTIKNLKNERNSLKSERDKLQNEVNALRKNL